MLRKSQSSLGSFLIFDRLVVDWKHFFERLDLKNLADARLNDGIAAHRRALEERSTLDKGMLFRSGRNASEGAPEEVTPEEAIVEDGMSCAHSGTIGSCLSGHDGSSYDPNFFRLAEDGSGIVAVNRGKPLGVDEANFIAEVFTHHHDVDGLAEVFKYLQEDLSVPTTSDHYDKLLRVLLFARDKERVDQTVEAVFDADRESGASIRPQPSSRWLKEIEGSSSRPSIELVTHETLARLVDACYAFQSTDDALKSALQLICSFQQTKKMPIVQVCHSGAEKAASNNDTALFSSCSLGSQSSTTELPDETRAAMDAANGLLRSLIGDHAHSHLESKPLSSLLHLTSQGNFHSLIPVIVATWMSLLGVRLGSWDLANLSAVLVSRPQDFPLVRAVFASMEEPPHKDNTKDPASLPTGSISIHALLYTLHARGFISDASFGRLRKLVLKLNTAVNETIVGVNEELASSEPSADNPTPIEDWDGVVQSLFEKCAASSEDDAPAALSMISQSFGRLKSGKEKSTTAASHLDGSSVSNSKRGRSYERTGAEFAYDTPRFFQWFNEFTEFATTRDEFAVKSLPCQLEAVLAGLIQAMAATVCLQRPVLDSERNVWMLSSLKHLPVSKSALVPQDLARRFGPQSDSPAALTPLTHNELASLLKAPVYLGWLNCREAAGSNLRMVMSMYEHAWGDGRLGGIVAPSIGPQRENIGVVYHYYATLQQTIRHDTEAVRTLGVVSDTLSRWEDTFAPLYSEIMTAMRMSAVKASSSSGTTTSALQTFIEERREQLVALQHTYFPTKTKSTDSAFADVCAGTSPSSLFVRLTPITTGGTTILSDEYNAIFPVEPPTSAQTTNDDDLRPILGLLAELAACSPFTISGMFFNDVGTAFSSVPMAVLSVEMPAFQALSNAALNPLVLRLKREHFFDNEDTKTLLAPLGLSPPKPTMSEDGVEIPVNKDAPPVYHALTEADQNYMAAHGLYFLDSTAAAQKAWAAIEASADGKDLPNRSVKKMLKMYGAMCARHPPRNCKLSPKGYEERLKFGLYVEARETALMLLGSGKESRDMMRHLFYNGNKLPAARNLESIVDDVMAISARLPVNPVARFTAERLREDTERVLGSIATLRRVSQAGDYAGDEQLEVVKSSSAKEATEEEGSDNTDLGDGIGGVVFVKKGKEQTTKSGKRYDAHDFTISSEGSASTVLNDLFAGTPGTSIAELHEYQRRAKLRINGNLAAVDMSLGAVFSEAVKRANPNTLPLGNTTDNGQSAPEGGASSSSSAAPTSSFSTEVSWIRGHPATLLPEHLFRGDIYNHFPHKNIKGMGILRETQEVVALSGGSEKDRVRVANAIAGSDDATLLVEAPSSQSSPSTSSLSSAVANVPPPPPPSTDDASIHPMTFFGYDDQFTEDPFIPLWNFINGAYSPTSSASVSGRAWYLDDIEMFELLLRNLLYRLDWENAAKLTLLMTQTPRSKKSRDHLEKLKGGKHNNRNQKNFFDVMSTRTNEILEDGVGAAENQGIGDVEALAGGSNGSSEWSFLTDHHVSKIFADIGDPGGFLPFKVAVKLFDGRIVSKTNRMGAVNVNPLLASAELTFDDDSDNRPSLHGSEKRRGAAGIGFRQ